MIGYIPEEKISEIRSAADIVDVISEVVVLKKTGRNYLGLCPFHSEKTPSFSVSPEKQIFYCFGCGAGGNVFSFLMKREGLSFPEAARVLSKRYGIQLPMHTLTPDQKRRVTERERLLEVNRLAMGFFHHTLIDPRTGRKAMAYLTARGMTDHTIQRFKIGFAPDRWDGLTRFVSERKTPLRIAEQAGLIISKKSGNGYYDRFRGRVIFPILNLSAQVIGFGARVMDDSLPKYMNSPESPVYNKRQNLYGIDRARPACRDAQQVYVVEGYFDLLALHQHGIENSVATLGTALTVDHARLLRGLAGNAGQVVLVFDSDEAGIEAARRCVDTFDKEYVRARVLILPKGHDPDSFLLEFGVDAFRERAAQNAKGIMTFLIDSAIERHGLSLEGKIQVLSELQKPLALIQDKVERSLYVRELAERIGIEESAVLEKVRRLSDTPPRPRRPHLSPPAAGGGENRLERQIVAMMLQYPAIIADIRKQGILDQFADLRLKHIGQLVLGGGHDSAAAVSNIISMIEDLDSRSLAAELAMGEHAWSHSGCLKLLAQYKATRARRADDLTRRIRDAEKDKDYALVNKLLYERQRQAVKR